MKSIFSIIIFLSFVLNLHSKENVRIDSTINYDFPDNPVKHVNTYDSIGRIVLNLQYSLKNYDKKIFSELNHEYYHDKDGNNVFYISDIRNTHNWINRLKEECRYDIRGHKIFTLRSSSYWNNDWFYDFKDDSVYDSLGHNIRNIRTQYVRNIRENSNSINKWLIFFNEEIIYNDRGKVSEKIISNRDHWCDSLKLHLKHIYKYDLNDNLIEDYVYKWNESSDSWENCRKYCYKNDSIGHHLFYSDSTWVEDSCLWRCLSVSTFNYDSKGNQVLNINYQSGYWKLDVELKLKEHSKKEFAYDANGNQILNSEYLWDDNLKCWIGKKKEEFTYDNNRNVTMTRTYIWNEQENKWNNQGLLVCNFDAHNNRTFMDNMFWDKTNQCWGKILNTKTYYKYNERGLPIETSQYVWHGAIKGWEGSLKMEIKYDSLGRQIDLVGSWIVNPKKSKKWYRYETYYESFGNLMMQIAYDWIDGKWQLGSKTLYDYRKKNNLFCETVIQIWYWDKNLKDWVRKEDYKGE